MKHCYLPSKAGGPVQFRAARKTLAMCKLFRKIKSWFCPRPKTLKKPRSGREPSPSMTITTEDRPDGGMDIHIRLDRSEVRQLRRDREFMQSRHADVSDDAATVRLMINYARHRFEYLRKQDRKNDREHLEWPDCVSDLVH